MNCLNGISHTISFIKENFLHQIKLQLNPRQKKVALFALGVFCVIAYVFYRYCCKAKKTPQQNIQIPPEDDAVDLVLNQKS